MSCIVAPELDSSNFLLLMKGDGFNLVHGSLKITLCNQHLVRGDVAHLNNEGLTSMRAEILAMRAGFLDFSSW